MKKRWLWLLAALPVAAGSGVAALIAVQALPNPILYLRGNLAVLAPLAGLLLSAAVLACLGTAAAVQRAADRRARQVHAETVAERLRFMGRLDHEFKNPLTSIQAGLVNILNGTASPSQQAALASVETDVTRLARLTVDMRRLADLERRPRMRTPVDLAALVQEEVGWAQQRPEAAERPIKLLLAQVPRTLPTISGDEDLLSMALRNLLTNALKFTRPGDSIEVRAFDDGAVANIEVADSGPGIPPEELRHVGEDLFRGRNAQGIPGSGLGLALARAVVEHHGGQLAVRSEVEQGTVVTVRLPLK